ncbi:hypothetical protein ACOSQ3_006150 [Xanthoceras sorbifolium]
MAISSYDQNIMIIPLVLLVIVIFTCTEAAAASFERKNVSFPGFDYERDKDRLLFSGKNTSIESGALQLTTNSNNEWYEADHYDNSGRIMYYQPFRIHNGLIMGSFNSTFVINLYRQPDWDPGHGLAFLIAPNSSLPQSSHGQWLGLTNSVSDGSRDNHVVAIEFDTEKQDFDPDDNHIGLNINSVRSTKSVPLNEHNITLSSSEISYKVWVQYDGTSQLLQVYMEKEGKLKPPKPLLTQTINLKEFLKQESYFGFSASTGFPQIQLNCVREWTLEIEVIPKKKDWKWLIITAGVGIPTLIIFLVLSIIFYVNKRRRRRVEEPHHEFGNLRYLPGIPREFKYKELKKATNNFNESMKLGEGGFGIVYKGTLEEKKGGPSEIAVKKFSRDNIKGKGDFLAELAIIHRLRHKHLVRLVGWCYEKGKLLLVYDFMPNGSLEKHLYGIPEQSTLNWNRRYRILTGIASALYYLQNEYDQKVVHRDLKASNILVDADFNGRLGDFGLARTIENERNSYAELGAGGVPGTMGYVAPECFHTGKATPESDVFGFGAVLLEIVCGRSPGIRIPHEQHFYTLVDWVWMLHREGRIEDAVDERLENNFAIEEANKVLLLGLACSHPIATERPKTEEILQIISGTLPAPYVPPFRPAFTWPSTGPATTGIDNFLTGITLSSQDYSSEMSSLSIAQTPSAPSPSFNLPVSA